MPATATALCLQDQLAPAITAAWPDAAPWVAGSQQLLAAGPVPADAASRLGAVLLYGADLAALEVAAALTDAGVPPGG